MNTKFKLTLPILFLTLLFSVPVSAERIRSCNGDLYISYYYFSPVETGQFFDRLRLGSAPTLEFTFKGRHGGRSANTARRRARDSMVDCFNEMVRSPDLPTEKITACENPYGGDDSADMVYQINGRRV